MAQSADGTRRYRVVRNAARRAVVLASLVALVTPAAIATLAATAPPASAGTQGNISTIAGTGTNGFNSDAQIATAAETNNPTGVAVDSSGNILIADRDNERIRVIASSASNPGYPIGANTWTQGQIFTIAGNGTLGYNGDGILATSAELRSPADVALDHQGNVLIADQANQRVRVIAMSVSNPGYPLAGCSGSCTWTPQDIFTIAGSGTGGYNNDGDLATADKLNGPGNVAVDGSGDVLIGDTVNGRIRIVAVAGSNPTYTLGGHNCPCTWTQGDIYTIAGSHSSGYAGDGGSAAGAGAGPDNSAAELSNPHGVTVDPEGNVVIADSSNNRIRVVANSAVNPGYSLTGCGIFMFCTWTVGHIFTIAGTGTAGYSGGDGINPTSASVNAPNDVHFDAQGNLLVADLNNHRVRLVAESASNPGYLLAGCAGTCTWTVGDIFTVAGTGTSGYNGDGAAATSSQLSLVSDLATDSVGNLYIADQTNYRIREVQVQPTSASGPGAITSVTGGGADGVNSGIPASSASIGLPVGVATDTEGNLIEADSTGALVRVVAESASNPGYPLGGCVSTCTWTVGDIFNIAGHTGGGGFNGDGIAATSAGLVSPNGVAVDDHGNVLIADLGNDRVRLVAVSVTNPGYQLGSDCSGACSWTPGSIYTIAGTGSPGFTGDGPATAAPLQQPIAVAVDHNGNVLVDDSVNARIRVIALTSSNPGYSCGGCAWAAGDIFTIAGDGTFAYNGDGIASSTAELTFSADLTVDASGNVLFSDHARTRVIAMSAANPGYPLSGCAGSCTWAPHDVFTIAGGGGSTADGVAATSASLVSAGVAFDHSGNVVVTDYNNGRVRVVAVSATNPGYVLGGEPAWTVGDIFTIAGSGTSGYNGDGIVATSAELDSPSDLALDSAGNVYVADYGNERIREIEVQSESVFSVPGNSPGPIGFQTPVTVPGSVSLSATGFWSEVPGLAFPRSPDGVAPFQDQSTYLLPTANAFALVGRIGTSGPWSLVGSGPTTLDGTGTLYLAMNDSAGNFGDNSGALTVTVNGLFTLSTGYDTPGPVINGGTINWGATLTSAGSSTITNAHVWADPAGELVPAQATVPTWQLFDAGNNPIGSPVACTSVVDSTPLFDCTVPQIDPGFSVVVGAGILAQGIEPVTVSDSFFLEHSDQTAGCYLGCIDPLAATATQRIDGLSFNISAPATVGAGFPLTITGTATNTSATQTISTISVSASIDRGTITGASANCAFTNNASGAQETCPPAGTFDLGPGDNAPASATIDTTGLGGQTIHYSVHATSPDVGGSTYTTTGSVFVVAQATIGVPATNPPIAPQVTAGSDAAWTVPIANTTAIPAHNVTITLDATATDTGNNTTPLAFDETAINRSLGLPAAAPTCAPGAGNTTECTLPADLAPHTTLQFTAFALTDGLTPDSTITGDIALSSTNALDSSGTLGAVSIVTCVGACAVGVAAPGDPFASSPAPPTPTNPTKQVLLLTDNDSGTALPPVAVTLQSIDPSLTEPASDEALCPTAPTATHCSGQISSVVAQFGKYVNAQNPIRVTIISRWGSSIPAGQILMEKSTGGDPLFLTACAVNPTTRAFNVPCVLPELVRGSAASDNLTTYDTILFTAVDLHFARRVSTGGTVIKAPAAPTALTATAGVGKAVLHWKAPTVTNGAGVTGYVVTVLVGGVVKKTIAYNTAALTQTITGLTKGTAYTFKVAAKNVAGTGAASAVSKAVKPT